MIIKNVPVEIIGLRPLFLQKGIPGFLLRLNSMPQDVSYDYAH